MYFVYFIKSKKNNSIYVGITNNLIRRLKQHNEGQGSTKRYRPWKYAYIEGYFLEEDAVKREKNIKYFGKVYSQLKRRIKNSLRDA